MDETHVYGSNCLPNLVIFFILDTGKSLFKIIIFNSPLHLTLIINNTILKYNIIDIIVN